MAVANSTAETPVYRGDGVRLYGMDAETELKVRAKRDAKLETELASWIAQLLQIAWPGPDLITPLRSGIILCRVANAIKPGSVRVINQRPIGALSLPIPRRIASPPLIRRVCMRGRGVWGRG